MMHSVIVSVFLQDNACKDAPLVVQDEKQILKNGYNMALDFKKKRKKEAN